MIKGRPRSIIWVIGTLIQIEEFLIGKKDAILQSVFLLQDPRAEVDSRFFVLRRYFPQTFKAKQFQLQIFLIDCPDCREGQVELTSSLTNTAAVVVFENSVTRLCFLVSAQKRLNRGSGQWPVTPPFWNDQQRVGIDSGVERNVCLVEGFNVGSANHNWAFILGIENSLDFFGFLKWRIWLMRVMWGKLRHGKRIWI